MGHVVVSTSFVYRLQSYSSPSTSITPTPGDRSPPDLEHALATPKLTNTGHLSSERTPLIRETDPHHAASHTHRDPDSSYGAVHHRGHTHDSLDGDASLFFEGHHRHESRGLHHSHHERSRPQTIYDSEEFEEAQPSGVGHVTHSEDGHHHHGFEDAEGVTDTPEDHHFHNHYHSNGHTDKDKAGKKRQIVGILVRLDLRLADPLITHVIQGVTIRYHDPFIGHRSDLVDNVGSRFQCVIVDFFSRLVLTR